MNEVSVDVDPNDRIFAYQHEVGAAISRGELAPAYATMRHIFLPGVYIREAVLPAGASFVGSVHLHDHASFVEGDITVVSAEGKRRIQGAEMVIAKAGTKRAVDVHALTTWRTVHPNPTEERDIAKLEAALVVPDLTPESIAYRQQALQ